MGTYSVGDRIKAKVKELLDRSAIVELDNGKLSTIPMSDISWSRRRKDPRELLSVGEEIEVVITGINQTRGHIFLSIKRVKEDPWKHISAKYSVGEDYLRTVTALAKFGAFVELEDGVEGLVHISELGPRRVGRHPEDVLSVGDKVRVIVTGVDPQQRQIALSISEYLQKIEDEGGKKYLSLDEPPETTRGKQFGELLEEFDIDWQRYDEEQKESVSESKTLDADSALSKILVVDDEEDVARSFRDLTQALGYDVDMVFSGQRAVELALESNYDAILMDLNMPEMDGVTAMKQIQAQNPDACIILVSVPHILRTVSLEDKLKASGILQKPTNALQIDRTIKEAMNGNKPGVSTTFMEDEEQLKLVKALAQASGDQKERELTLTNKLELLRRATNASACAIFEMNVATEEVNLVVQIGINTDDFEEVRYELRYSPVRDVIIEDEHLLYHNITKIASRKFRKLLPIIKPPFGSCIGVPMTVLQQRRYGLFLFHPSPHHFEPSDLLYAEAAATSISSAIEYERIQDAIEGSQRLMLMGQLLSGLGHDIPNRLEPLSHYCDLVLMDIDRVKKKADKPDRKDIDLLDSHLREIIRAKDKTIGVANMFLEMTKEDKPELTDISECVQKVKDALEGQATTANVEIDLDIDEDVGQVKADSRALEQILLNLILNAVQQMANEKITHGRVEVKGVLDESLELPIKIRISDNGPGIHKNCFDTIFDFGFSTRPGGSGMGLYLCRQLAKRLGGRIGIEDSVIFLGSTFLMELPSNSTGE